jgi:branched-chain amino acid transport system permease protein
MTEIFGIPLVAILGQLMLGLVNGSFYALLSLGLAVIFGLMGVVNFAHGAFYTLGAFAAAVGLSWLGIGYWPALILAPLAVAVVGIVAERLLLRHLYRLDPLYGLLLTFGLALMAEGLLFEYFGSSGQSYPVPEALQGAWNLGFMILPIYRGWVILASVVVCFATWFLIERTRLGATLRAATENAPLLQAFGINVPLIVAATYGTGVALAAFAGVLSAPVIQVSPQMGQSVVIVVFAVVVIGGMGSILGSIVTGLALGLVEGLTKVIYPEASNIVVFVIMALVLVFRPAGLFGRS